MLCVHRYFFSLDRVEFVQRPLRKLPSLSSRNITLDWRWISMSTNVSARKLPSSPANPSETRSLGNAWLWNHKLILRIVNSSFFRFLQQFRHPFDEASSTQDCTRYFHQTARGRAWEKRQLRPRDLSPGYRHHWNWCWDQGHVENAGKSY